MRRPLAALLATLLLLLGAGCGDDDDEEEADRTSTTTTAPDEDGTTSSTAGSGTTSPPTTAFDGGTEPVTSAPPAGNGTALLAAVRLAAQPGFDRIVFEFENRVPGYAVRYVEPPIRESGSGNEVEVDGDAFLEVQMEPASGVDLSGETFRQTYTGPDRVRSDTTAVVEAVRTGDFEANLDWVLGVDERRAFRVQVLDGPPRLVIDVSSAG